MHYFSFNKLNNYINHNIIISNMSIILVNIICIFKCEGIYHFKLYTTYILLFYRIYYINYDVTRVHRLEFNQIRKS